MVKLLNAPLFVPPVTVPLADVISTGELDPAICTVLLTFPLNVPLLVKFPLMIMFAATPGEWFSIAPLLIVTFPVPAVPLTPMVKL